MTVPTGVRDILKDSFLWFEMKHASKYKKSLFFFSTYLVVKFDIEVISPEQKESYFLVSEYDFVDCESFLFRTICYYCPLISFFFQS